MAYAGLPPASFTNNLTNVQLIDDISGSFNGSTQTFALTSNSAPFHAVSARSLLVTLGGITQKPQVDYTVDGSNITFTTAPVNGLTFAARNIYGLNYLNNVNDGVITPAKLSTGAPTWNAGGTLTVSGDLNVTGSFNSGTQGLFWGDNEPANFGNDNDLKIYHSGVNSFIRDQGTGSLFIEGTDLTLRAADSTTRYLVANETNGDVSLFYGNLVKLATTTAGVNITGTLKVNNIASLDSTTLSLGLEGGANGFINTQESLYVNIDSNNDETGKRFEIRHGTTDASGTQLFTVLDSGNVGIGTADPNYALVVAKQDNAVMIREGAGTLAEMTNNTSQKLWFQGGNAELGLFKNSDGSYEYILGSWQSVSPIPLVFRTGNRVERMRITYDGNVGIGTTNPGDSRLFIDRQFNSTYATNAYNDDFLLIKNNSTIDGTAASIYMLATGSGNSAAVGTINLIHTNNGSGALSFQTRNNGGMIEAVRIASTGNVGIGTTNPAYKTEILGGSSATESTILLLRSNSPDANTGTVLRFINSTSNSTTFGTATITALRTDYATGFTDFVFKNSVGDSLSETLRIKANGNVGIGTTNPDKKLRVEGDARITGTLTMGTASIEIAGDSEFPTTRPTLDLNFAATKTLDRRITFTRDSIGTYIDELGIVKYASNNVPRFDHDPVTGESLGLLIEESRTNLVPDSTTYNGWTTYSSSIPSITQETLAPDGTYSAIKIISTGTQSQFGFREELSYSANTVYTHSMWLKAGTATRVGLTISSSSRWTTFPYLIVDLDTGTVNSTGGSISTKLTAYPNGWYLLEATGQFGGTSQTDGIWSYTATPGGHSGDTTSYYYQWGGQIEQGSFATSYIPTSGSTVTRAQDFAKITGTNFTDFYNQEEGTLVCDQSVSNLDTANQYSVILSSSINESIGMGYRVGGGASGDYGFYIIKSGDALFRNVTDVVSADTPIRTALAYKLNDGATVVNGESAVNDTSLVLPTPDRMLIGDGYSASNELKKGHIRKISYYNKRLTNSQLQSLTRQ